MTKNIEDLELEAKLEELKDKKIQQKSTKYAKLIAESSKDMYIAFEKSELENILKIAKTPSTPLQGVHETNEEYNLRLNEYEKIYGDR